MEKTIRKCPTCGKMYAGYPALSRKDNKTEICGTCGMIEALDAYYTHASVDLSGGSEDRDEAMLVKFWGDTREECNADCPACSSVLISGGKGLPNNYNFCPVCGQRIKWEAE